MNMEKEEEVMQCGKNKMSVSKLNDGINETSDYDQNKEAEIRNLRLE